MWITYAVRPLSSEELDVVLAFEDARESTTALSDHVYCGSVTDLEGLLPGIVGIECGKAVLYIPSVKAQQFVSNTSSHYLPAGSSPHPYIARSCLLLLKDHILDHLKVREGRFEAEPGQPTGEVEPATKEMEVDEPVVEKSAVRKSAIEESVTEGPSTGEPAAEYRILSTTQDWEIGQIIGPAQALAEYVAQHWITHYQLAGADFSSDDEAFLAFVGEEPEVKGWVKILTYLSRLNASPGSHMAETLPENLQERLHIGSFKEMQLLCWLFSRPSSVTVLDRLLVGAAEAADLDLVCTLCEDITSVNENAVIRAIATASGSVYQELIRAAGELVKEPENLATIHLTALALGNFETAERIMQRLTSFPADLFPPRWFYNSLEVASEYGDVAVVNALLSNGELSKGLIVESEKPSGWSALHIAADTGDFEIVSRLHEAGMSVNDSSPDGQSSLVLVIAHGFVELARYLVEQGVQTDQINSSEMTPLHIASQYGFLTIVKLLLSKHAVVAAVDDNGDFPLHLAIRNKNREIAELLVEELGQAPAFAENKTANGAKIIPSGDDVGDDAHVFNPGDDEVAELELDLSYNNDDYEVSEVIALNGANSDGVTPLINAVERNMTSVVERLIEKGADSNVSDDNSMTPLHFAAKNGSAVLVQYLLDKGAEENETEYGIGFMSLYQSSYHGHANTTEVLLKSDLNLTVWNDWGLNALETACRQGHLHIAQLLLPHYEKEFWGKCLLTAAQYGRREILEFLLDSGCDVNAKDSGSNTALHFAALFGNSSILQILLLRRADLESIDSKGNTALNDAAGGDSLETLKVLIEASASMENKGDTGQSPLSAAIFDEKPRTVRLLLENGARMMVPPLLERHESLLEFTLNLSTFEVIEVLVDFYRQGKEADGLTVSKALELAITKDDKRLLQLLLDAWANSEGTTGSVVTALHFAASRGTSTSCTFSSNTTTVFQT